MHLQQTKRESSATGRPQYYFHDLTDPIKTYLRKTGAVPVALITPYGATKSSFFAVGKDHKLDQLHKPIQGSVGHDRIQQGSAVESIGESIRYWYVLPKGQFERIDVEIDIIDNAFYLRPVKCRYSNSERTKEIRRTERPLTFITEYFSPFWRDQLTAFGKSNPALLEWSVREISRVVDAHRKATKMLHVQEQDLLRASGPLAHMGISLGPYVGKGYDCLTEVRFLKYPTYTVHFEIKKSSKGFRYQQQKYGKDELSRAVVLCAKNDHPVLPAHIDVIELEAFREFGRQFLSITL